MNLAIDQLRGKIQEVVKTHKNRDDLLVMVGWVEDSIKNCRKSNDSLRKNMAWDRKYIAEKTEECTQLQAQIDELEAEINA